MYNTPTKRNDYMIRKYKVENLYIANITDGIYEQLQAKLPSTALHY